MGGRRGKSSATPRRTGAVTRTGCSPSRDERPELAPIHDAHVEQHPRVVQPAELRAVAPEEAEPGRRDGQLVALTGEEVTLDEEARHVERVDDVGRLEADAGGSTDRQH